MHNVIIKSKAAETTDIHALPGVYLLLWPPRRRGISGADYRGFMFFILNAVTLPEESGALQ
jgi:hypothetical protein